MAKTQQSTMVAALIKRGWHELTATRYVGCRAFRHDDKPGTILFVGKAGSLRAGQNRTTSMTVSAKFKQSLLDEGKGA